MGARDLGTKPVNLFLYEGKTCGCKYTMVFRVDCDDWVWIGWGMMYNLTRKNQKKKVGGKGWAYSKSQITTGYWHGVDRDRQRQTDRQREREEREIGSFYLRSKQICFHSFESESTLPTIQ